MLWNTMMTMNTMTMNSADSWKWRSTTCVFFLVTVTWCLAVPHPIAVAQEPAEASQPTQVSLDAEELKREDALKTAVALNYCRAAFHRIRKDPTAAVLKQEEEKILNNLNLTQVEQKEVISLYTAVLDEISQVEITDEEKRLYEQHHKASIRRQVTWDALAFGTELATAQFGSAVRTGANSWWDYRNKAFQRDMDLLKIEKVEIGGLMRRSNQLLDTFWEMARKKEIPDRWLVRGDDLDELETAVAEEDAEKRLRILNRMKPFMEAYPPYWYYLSRTQQELGQLNEAIETYSYLDKIGQGHFRKDDMLATAMANKAAILDFLGDARAVASAEQALKYSPDVWEANLIAARILQRHGRVALAEDAILRNLDVQLEQGQSTIFLAALYYYSRDEEKVIALMNNAERVAHLPAPVLLRCAALVGAKRTPQHVMQSILASLSAYPQSRFGKEELTLRVSHAWQLHLASFEVRHNGSILDDPQVIANRGYYDLRYIRHAERNLPVRRPSSSQEIELALNYPDDTVIRLQLSNPSQPTSRSPIAFVAPTPQLRISGIEVDDQTLAFNIQEAMHSETPLTVEAAKPVFDAEPQDEFLTFPFPSERDDASPFEFDPKQVFLELE